MNDDRLVLVDIETTGLDVDNDLILEVGFRIITPQLDLVDEFDVTICDEPQFSSKKMELERRAREGDKNADYVLNMHTESGLWNACMMSGLPYDAANDALVDWLKGHGLNGMGDPMVGSSVHFDRGFLADQMPDVNALFHYRNIDISSIKEMCRRLNPQVYARLAEVPKVEKHRSLSDLADTTGELGFYMDNFLFVTV